jgi:hypothetical protein
LQLFISVFVLSIFVLSTLIVFILSASPNLAVVQQEERVGRRTNSLHDTRRLIVILINSELICKLLKLLAMLGYSELSLLLVEQNNA